MADSLLRGCELTDEAVGNSQTAEAVWDIILSTGMPIRGKFKFHAGADASLKIDSRFIYRHPNQYAQLIGLFASIPCVKDAELLLDPPRGWRKFTTRLGFELSIPVIHPARLVDSFGRKYFDFNSASDRDIATGVTSSTIVDDVTSTLLSIAQVRQLLPVHQSIHSLDMLLRGRVDPANQMDIVDHHLLERFIPTDAQEFDQLMQQGWS